MQLEPLSRRPAVAPPLRVEYEPRFCGTTATNLTAGCSFACIYCPFSALAARRGGVHQPTVVDMTPLESVSAPPSLFLSSSSDAFAPQATPHTHALLERFLPQGTVVSIVTKGVIPQRTIELLAAYRAQIEGVGIGVTSMDDHRNRVLEPGCPPAATRLDNIDRLANAGLMAGLRLDPLFPELDDLPEALEALTTHAARRGAVGVTASYVFAYGRYLRRLRHEPLLAESSRHLTEPAPMTGGSAWSVSLVRKLDTYTLIARLAARHGIGFSTCGCKDLRIRDSGRFLTSCRNPYFDGPCSEATIRT